MTRRDVLRGLGGFALAGATGSGAELTGEPVAGITACASSPIAAVANRTLAIPGSIEAYAQKSVAAGGTVDFRIHSTVPYQLSIVRLGWDTESPSRDWVLQSFPESPAAPCVIRPGSYIHVENALSPTVHLTQLTVEAWVRPFRNAWQGVISQYTYASSCGLGLFLGSNGQPCYYFGDGGAFNGAWLRTGAIVLAARQWYHLAAVFEAGTARLYVNGTLVDSATGFPAAVTPGTSPLRLGAYGDSSGTANFLDGDLAMPVLYSRALRADEILARARSTPPSIPTERSLIGCWPLDEETGATVRDAGACSRQGLIVNRGTWMIGGPGFAAASVPRFGPYNPDTDPTRGHALRLSSSDLYDCAWPISRSCVIPSECPPGVYVGRITYGSGSRYDVTFVVRRAANRPNAPVLVLCATNTWHAYNHSLGLYSFYAPHAAGQPTYHQGLEMPWASSTDPYAQYIPAYSYSHLLRAERFTHVWLEQNGLDHDVISDLDLHQNPSILGAYRTLFIVGHSEYWSAQAYSAVLGYLAGGGKVIMASGNSMFWRVSFDGSVIECRKLPTTVGGFQNAQWGELYHEHDHQRGGLMREAGYPEWQAVGLECVGYGGPHVPYKVSNAAHVYFQTPEPIPVVAGTQIGGAFGVGHEWDARLQSIPGSSTPPIPPSYTPVVLAEGRGDANRLDYQCNWVTSANSVISEIVDWQKPNGGRVFSVGSIAAGQALHADKKMAALFRNVLHHNGIIYRLNAMAIGQDGHFYGKSFDGQSWLPSFTAWDDAGAGFGDHPPVGAQWGPNSLAAAAITAKGSFYYRYHVGSWSAWLDFGASFLGRPAAVGWGRNRLDLFARGTDAHLYRKAWDGSAWTGWTDLGGSIASDPAAIGWEGTNLSVAVRGAGGNILYKWYRNDAWYPASGWTDMGLCPDLGPFVHAPTLLAWGGKLINVFTVGANGRSYSKHWNGSAWYPSLTTWQDLGGALASPVRVGIWGRDQFTLFAIGQDGRMKAKWWDGTAWGPSLTDWSDLGGAFIGEPAVASYRGHYISVMAVATKGRLQHRLWDGHAWSEWQDMGGNLRGGPAVFRWIYG